MSDDRKPGRVRLVAGAGGNTATQAVPAVETPIVAPTDATASGKRKGGAKAALVPVALFLIGCIGGGVAVARLVP